MRVLITGGGGFIGQALARALLARGTLADREGAQVPIDELVLLDVGPEPSPPVDGAKYVQADLTSPGALALVSEGVDAVFHLAAVVSGAAEADFDLGMKVNFDATRSVLTRCRRLETKPRVIFTSSVAIYGAGLSVDEQGIPYCTDSTPANPRSSYGTQKLMAEMLITDMSRKGFIDGRIVRLPTVVVRPGAPNAAASSFCSGIVREPLAGQPANCPVRTDLPLWVKSPASVVESLILAHDLPEASWESGRALNLPGLVTTPKELIDAMASAGGDAALVSYNADEKVAAIVASWPGYMQTPRALEMGFVADADVNAVVQQYVKDHV